MWSVSRVSRQPSPRGAAPAPASPRAPARTRLPRAAARGPPALPPFARSVRSRGPVATRVYMHTLGCPKNRVDSEVMLGTLAEAGYRLVQEPEEAEVIVVNTCGFIESAKVESVDAIVGLAELKREGRCKKLVVTGCLVQRHGAELARELPEVDHFLGTGAYADVARIVSDAQAKRLDAAGELAPVAHRLPQDLRGLRQRLRLLHHPEAARPAALAPDRGRRRRGRGARAAGHDRAVPRRAGPHRVRDRPPRPAAAPRAPARAREGGRDPLDAAPLRLPARRAGRARRDARGRAEDREVPRHAAPAQLGPAAPGDEARARLGVPARAPRAAPRARARARPADLAHRWAPGRDRGGLRGPRPLRRGVALRAARGVRVLARR